MTIKVSETGIERRSLAVERLEVREVEEGPPTISGYAAVFDRLSEPLGGFRERIAPGAFAGSLGGDIRALWNHDSNFVLGRTKSGTLRLSEDGEGLRIEIDPPDTQYARDLMISIGRGDVDQMSFGFQVLEDDWAKDSDDTIIRTLKKVELLEVSPVTFPAYPQTSVAVRDKLAAMEEESVETPPEPRSIEMHRRRLDLLERM